MGWGEVHRGTRRGFVCGGVEGGGGGERGRGREGMESGGWKGMGAVRGVGGGRRGAMLGIGNNAYYRPTEQ